MLDKSFHYFRCPYLYTSELNNREILQILDLETIGLFLNSGNSNVTHGSQTLLNPFGVCKIYIYEIICHKEDVTVATLQVPVPFVNRVAHIIVNTTSIDICVRYLSMMYMALNVCRTNPYVFKILTGSFINMISVHTCI